nr:hypothetical protein [Tanacetum cinerariifolium]
MRASSTTKQLREVIIVFLNNILSYIGCSCVGGISIRHRVNPISIRAAWTTSTSSQWWDRWHRVNPISIRAAWTTSTSSQWWDRACCWCFSFVWVSNLFGFLMFKAVFYWLLQAEENEKKGKLRVEVEDYKAKRFEQTFLMGGDILKEDQLIPQKRKQIENKELLPYKKMAFITKNSYILLPIMLKNG